MEVHLATGGTLVRGRPAPMATEVATYVPPGYTAR